MIRQETSISELINTNLLSSYTTKTLIAFFLVSLFNGYFFIIGNVINPFISASFSLSTEISNPQFMIFMLVGMVLSGTVCGMISDRIGRRKPLIASIFLAGFFAFIQAFITNPFFFYVNQVVIGFFIVSSLSIMMTYIVEIAPSKKRSFYTGIILGGFIFGCFLSALSSPSLATFSEPLFLEFLTDNKIMLITGNTYYENWRVCYIGGLAEIIISVIVSYIISESPHWYANNGKKQEAAMAIYDACSNEVVDDEQIDPTHITIPPKPTSRMQEMLLSKAFLSTTIPLWTLSFIVMFFVYFMFSLYPYWIQDLGKSIDEFRLIQCTCMAVSFISCLIAAKINDIVSRRVSLTIGWIFGIISVLLISFLLTYPASGASGLLLNIFLLMLSTSIGWCFGALAIHFTENYPPTLRNSGVSWILSVGGCGAIVSIALFMLVAKSSNISYVDNAIFDWKFIFLLLSIPLLLGLFISIFKIKETINKTLDDISQENSGAGTTFVKTSTIIVGLALIAISVICYISIVL